jgi:hypothetical protein
MNIRNKNKKKRSAITASTPLLVDVRSKMLKKTKASTTLQFRMAKQTLVIANDTELKILLELVMDDFIKNHGYEIHKYLLGYMHTQTDKWVAIIQDKCKATYDDTVSIYETELRVKESEKAKLLQVAVDCMNKNLPIPIRYPSHYNGYTDYKTLWYDTDEWVPVIVTCYSGNILYVNRKGILLNNDTDVRMGFNIHLYGKDTWILKYNKDVITAIDMEFSLLIDRLLDNIIPRDLTRVILKYCM